MTDAKALLGLNPLLTDKVRLALVVELTTSEEPLDFNTLLETLELTKGNLSSHMRKLELAGLVEVHKQFVGRKPRTTYEATDKARKELTSYLQTLETVLRKNKSTLKKR